MEPFLGQLAKRGVLVADGAMGTMLMRGGLPPGQCPEAFNLEQPQAVAEITRLYREAGAEIIQTNTFGASPLKLANYGLACRTEEINRRAVEIARNAAAGQAYVSASIGPSGKLLKPYGDVEYEELEASYERQVAALLAAAPDLLCIETMSDIQEALAALRAARRLAPHHPVMATMTFDRTPRGFFTLMGVSVKQAADELAAAGADLVGSNCGNGMENMVAVAAEFKKHSRLPVLIQANAGIPEIRQGQAVYPETPDFMATKARELVALGVAVIGGCCGTTPEHIRAIRSAVDSLRG